MNGATIQLAAYQVANIEKWKLIKYLRRPGVSVDTVCQSVHSAQSFEIFARLAVAVLAAP